MRRAAALGADYSHSAAGAATRFYPTRVTNSLNTREPIVIAAATAAGAQLERVAGHPFRCRRSPAEPVARDHTLLLGDAANLAADAILAGDRPGGAFAQRTLSGHI